MSSTMLAFDTYKYAARLKEAGFTEAQAEAQTVALTEVMDTHIQNLATKDDLRLLAAELRGEIEKLRSEIAPLRWMIAPTAVSLVATVLGMAALLMKNFA